MAYVSTKNKFHVALNGVGLLLQGAPDRLAYQQNQSPVYGNRFASGDRDYNDLSQWWYFIQSDWSGGFKDFQTWADDAKFYYSTNIDAWSERGAIKLTREQYPSGAAGDNDFTYRIRCGNVGVVNNVEYKFVGISDSADNRPHVWQSDTGQNTAWTDVSTTTFATTRSDIAQISASAGILWVSTIGTSGVTFVVNTWDGTTWTDQSAFIYNAGATISFQPIHSRCHVTHLGITYVFVDDHTNNDIALVKTSSANPTGAGNWSKAFENLNQDGIPVACAGYNGNIYYLLSHSGYYELWAWNIAGATNTLIWKFNSAQAAVLGGVGDRLLTILNDKLIITIPNNEIWQLDGTTMTRILVKDIFKRGQAITTGAELDAILTYGCVVADNKCWWSNLMYDGTSFFNTWKNDTDSANSDDSPIPIFADSSNIIFETVLSDTSTLWSVVLPGGATANYKGTADKNFIVFSNLDKVQGIEKLAYSVTVLFKAFASGQSIVVEYLSGEYSIGASWTTLGTASATLDGTSVLSKTFFFPVATIFNKIWFRVKLNGGGTDTPTMTDFVMEYLPVPSYKKLWTINVNAGESVRRLDGALTETTGRELKSLLETAWWTKSTLDYQDLDYATTTVSDNPLTAGATTITVPSEGTRDFPEQGRLRIEDEEILYTGKTTTTFTGCTRGARGTRAVSHTQNTVVNNAYKVIITDLQTRVPISLKGKVLEYTVGVSLREV